MSRATWVQTNFNAGEWSPLAHGRFDIAKYKNGLAECLNFMPTQQGGLTKRPGTRYVAAVKDSTYAPRLQRFEFSVDQAYILEFGNYYIRFFANDGQVLTPSPLEVWASGHTYYVGDVVDTGSGFLAVCLVEHVAAGLGWVFDGGSAYWAVLVGSPGDPLEIVTTYTSAEVWELNFVQSADTLFIVHPSHPPMKLQRHSIYGWSLADVAFLDGPYLFTNTTSTILTPDGTSGTVSVVASSATGINGGTGFRASDVGRALRIKCSSVWVWGLIATVSDPLNITWAINGTGYTSAPITARATANISGGSVFSCTITDGGSGYGSQPPSVTFLSAPTTDATGHVSAVDGGGAITSVAVDLGGTGYSSYPTVAVTSVGVGARLEAGISGAAVNTFYILEGGSGYSLSDPVVCSGGGAMGSGAVAFANLTNGVVTSITISTTGTGYTSAPAVVLSAPVPIAAGPSTFWRLGEWNAADGYPSVVTFHQDRLIFAGAANTPGRVDGSNTGDYENFAPSNQDGTIVDSNAVAFTLNTGAVNAIRWLVSDENGLLVGTAGSEWVVSSSSAQQSLTPTNVNTKPLGNYGSAKVPPVRVGKATLFIQRTGRKLREMFYQFTVNTFQSPDISLVSEHLTKSGIKQMALQLAPQQIVWMGRNDSKLIGMTYDKDQEVCGWHGHILGGFSDVAQTVPALVESVAGIPAPSIQRDEIWVVGNRYVNGAVSRTVEVFTKPWEDGDAIQNAVFMDSSAVYSGAPTTTVSGLTWLKGQTVKVLADGSVHPDCVVTNAGGITLQRSASTIQVGLGYIARGKTLRIEAGGADGPSQGKMKRIFRTVFRFFQTVGLDLMSAAPGIGFFPQPFRDSSDPMDQPVPLFDGDKRWAYDGTWESDGQIYFQSSDPLPCNITLLMAQLDTQDNQ